MLQGIVLDKVFGVEGLAGAGTGGVALHDSTVAIVVSIGVAVPHGTGHDLQGHGADKVGRGVVAHGGVGFGRDVVARKLKCLFASEDCETFGSL